MNQDYNARLEKILGKTMQMRNKAYVMKRNDNPFPKLAVVKEKFTINSPQPRCLKEIEDGSNSSRAITNDSTTKNQSLVKKNLSDEVIYARNTFFDVPRLRIKAKTTPQTPKLFFKLEKKNTGERYKDHESQDSLTDFDN